MIRGSDAVSFRNGFREPLETVAQQVPRSFLPSAILSVGGPITHDLAQIHCNLSKPAARPNCSAAVPGAAPPPPSMESCVARCSESSCTRMYTAVPAPHMDVDRKSVV